MREWRMRYIARIQSHKLSNVRMFIWASHIVVVQIYAYKIVNVTQASMYESTKFQRQKRRRSVDGVLQGEKYVSGMK